MGVFDSHLEDLWMTLVENGKLSESSMLRRLAVYPSRLARTQDADQQRVGASLRAESGN